MKTPLTLVGFHERNVLDAMLHEAENEFLSRDYSGIIFTGTSKPDKPMLSGDHVNDELRYMGSHFSNRKIPIIGKVPSRNLLGNFLNVVREFGTPITFLLDRSQMPRAEGMFLPYLQNRKRIEDVRIIAPKKSFRDQAYLDHTSKMDIVYRAELAFPGSSHLLEYLSCHGNTAIDYFVDLKNRMLQGKESRA